MLFSLDQMLLCIAFYLQVIGFITHFKVIKDFTFLIYLSMQIDSFTWQARVGIFNSSKSLLKTQIRNRGKLQFLLHHTVYSLYFS